MIPRIEIDTLFVSRLALGCGKFVNLTPEKARELVIEASGRGINLFDAHNRYGCAEEVLSFFCNVNVMTKVSAYAVDIPGTCWRHIVQSIRRLENHIDIFWISDLDNEELFEKGKQLYDVARDMFLRVGITMECAKIAERFSQERPECKFFMLPVSIDHYRHNAEFIKHAHKEGKYVFVIKPFCDGHDLYTHSVKQCLEYLHGLNPDVIVAGASSKEHLHEICDVYEALC